MTVDLLSDKKSSARGINVAPNTPPATQIIRESIKKPTLNMKTLNMKPHRFLPAIIAVLIGATSSASAALVGHWTFEGGSLADSTGNFGDLILHGDAAVSNGALDITGSGTTASGWASTPGGGVAIGSKTLVSWITLQGLNDVAQHGAAMSLDSISVDKFDGIVFGERDANRWMNGSTNFQRTPADQFDQTAVSVETATGSLIQLAISYESLGGDQVQITGYRNGDLMGSYTSGSFATWEAGDQEVLFGPRHTAPATNGALDALVHEARLYDTALAQSDIRALIMVPEPSAPLLGMVAAGMLLARRRRREARVK